MASDTTPKEAAKSWRERNPSYHKEYHAKKKKQHEQALQLIHNAKDWFNEICEKGIHVNLK